MLRTASRSPVDAVEDALGLGAERAACLGEHDAPTEPDEQLDAELGLELAHLLRERGLRDEQRARGPGERAVLCRGQEVAQLGQSHRKKLSVMK